MYLSLYSCIKISLWRQLKNWCTPQSTYAYPTGYAYLHSRTTGLLCCISQKLSLCHIYSWRCWQFAYKTILVFREDCAVQFQYAVGYKVVFQIFCEWVKGQRLARSWQQDLFASRRLRTTCAYTHITEYIKGFEIAFAVRLLLSQFGYEIHHPCFVDFQTKNMSNGFFYIQ